VALLGCAHTTHAWSYARALSASRGARLVGVFDDTPALAAPVCRDFGAPFHGDARALAGDADVAAVVVCSATSEHRPLVELAASLGRHVLCEKPVATTVEDGEAMVTACRDAGVQLHTAFVSRFLPLVAQARAAVGAGQIGELLGMVGGNRGRPPLPPTYPEWITTPEGAGGGALMDHSVHVTDVMRHVSGREVVQVYAEAGSLLWGCGVDDAALLSLVLDGGVVASVDPSWSVPEGNPWDYDFYLRLVGTRGSLDFDDLAESLHLVTAGQGLRLVPFGVDADARMVEAFLASVRAGEVLAPCATGEDGLAALRVAVAGYRSADAAAPVRLS
jgi:predicted dehydrogenase